MAKRKNPAAVALGRKGGKTSAEKLTDEERREKARKAAQTRWTKKKTIVAHYTCIPEDPAFLVLIRLPKRDSCPRCGESLPPNSCIRKWFLKESGRGIGNLFV